ncbi:unnamed protein product [Meloidogyne enterolobii]|uniref:Uncharacterized protein n=1 Tax=Meloidogyne enterolobii TaxID=390850 RepID=A0ACB0XU87_MELEN
MAVLRYGRRERSNDISIDLIGVCVVYQNFTIISLDRVLVAPSFGHSVFCLFLILLRSVFCLFLVLVRSVFRSFLVLVKSRFDVPCSVCSVFWNSSFCPSPFFI